MARAVRALQPPLPRSVQARALRSELRASHGRLVRAEASRRGLRGDLRRLAYAALALAPALPGLARHAQAPLRRSHGARAGRHRASRASRLHRHHGGGDEHDGRGILSRAGAGAGARRRRARARSARLLRAPPPGRAPRRRIPARASRDPREQDRVLDGGAPERHPGAGGEDRGDLRPPRSRRAGGGGGRHPGGADGVRDDPRHELPHPRPLHPARPPRPADGRRGQTATPTMRIIVAHGADESIEKRRRAGARPTCRRSPPFCARPGTRCRDWPWTARRSACGRSPRRKPISSSTWWSPSATTTPRSRTWPAYYDLLGLRYTGSGARGLTLAMDKALAKKVFSFHGVATPALGGRLAREAGLGARHRLSRHREARPRGRVDRHRLRRPRRQHQGAHGAHRSAPRRVRPPRAHRAIHRGPRDLHGRARQPRSPRPCRPSSSTSRTFRRARPASPAAR